MFQPPPGYYDPHSNTITINRRFDTADTPRVLVEYVMYHEMLHQHLGVEANGGVTPTPARSNWLKSALRIIKPPSN